MEKESYCPVTEEMLSYSDDADLSMVTVVMMMVMILMDDDENAGCMYWWRLLK